MASAKSKNKKSNVKFVKKSNSQKLAAQAGKPQRHAKSSFPKKKSTTPASSSSSGDPANAPEQARNLGRTEILIVDPLGTARDPNRIPQPSNSSSSGAASGRSWSDIVLGPSVPPRPMWAGGTGDWNNPITIDDDTVASLSINPSRTVGSVLPNSPDKILAEADYILARTVAVEAESAVEVYPVADPLTFVNSTLTSTQSPKSRAINPDSSKRPSPPLDAATPMAGAPACDKNRSPAAASIRQSTRSTSPLSDPSEKDRVRSAEAERPQQPVSTPTATDPANSMASELGSNHPVAALAPSSPTADRGAAPENVENPEPEPDPPASPANSMAPELGSNDPVAALAPSSPTADKGAAPGNAFLENPEPNPPPASPENPMASELGSNDPVAALAPNSPTVDRGAASENVENPEPEPNPPTSPANPMAPELGPNDPVAALAPPSSPANPMAPELGPNDLVAALAPPSSPTADRGNVSLEPNPPASPADPMELELGSNDLVAALAPSSPTADRGAAPGNVSLETPEPNPPASPANPMASELGSNDPVAALAPSSPTVDRGAAPENMANPEPEPNAPASPANSMAPELGSNDPVAALAPPSSPTADRGNVSLEANPPASPADPMALELGSNDPVASLAPSSPTADRGAAPENVPLETPEPNPPASPDGPIVNPKSIEPAPGRGTLSVRGRRRRTPIAGHLVGHSADDVPARNTRKRKSLAAVPVSPTIANTRPPRTAAAKAREYIHVVTNSSRIRSRSPEKEALKKAEKGQPLAPGKRRKTNRVRSATPEEPSSKPQGLGGLQDAADVPGPILRPTKRDTRRQSQVTVQPVAPRRATRSAATNPPAAAKPEGAGQPETLPPPNDEGQRQRQEIGPQSLTVEGGLRSTPPGGGLPEGVPPVPPVEQGQGQQQQGLPSPVPDVQKLESPRPAIEPGQSPTKDQEARPDSPSPFTVVHGRGDPTASPVEQENAQEGPNIPSRPGSPTQQLLQEANDPRPDLQAAREGTTQDREDSLLREVDESLLCLSEGTPENGELTGGGPVVTEARAGCLQASRAVGKESTSKGHFEGTFRPRTSPRALSSSKRSSVVILHLSPNLLSAFAPRTSDAGAATTDSAPAPQTELEAIEAAENLMKLANQPVDDSSAIRSNPLGGYEDGLRCRVCSKTMKDIRHIREALKVPLIPDQEALEEHVETCLEYAGADTDTEGNVFNLYDSSDSNSSCSGMADLEGNIYSPDAEERHDTQSPEPISYYSNRETPETSVFSQIPSVAKFQELFDDPELTLEEGLAIEETLVFAMYAAQAEWRHLNQLITAKVGVRRVKKKKTRKGERKELAPRTDPWDPEHPAIHEEKTEAALYGLEDLSGKYSMRREGLRARQKNFEQPIAPGYEASTGAAKSMEPKLTRGRREDLVPTRTTTTPAPTAALRTTRPAATATNSDLFTAALMAAAAADQPTRRGPGRPRKDGLPPGTKQQLPTSKAPASVPIVTSAQVTKNVFKISFGSQGRESMKGILSRDVSPRATRPTSPRASPLTTRPPTPQITRPPTPRTAGSTTPAPNEQPMDGNRGSPGGVWLRHGRPKRGDDFSPTAAALALAPASVAALNTAPNTAPGAAPGAAPSTALSGTAFAVPAPVPVSAAATATASSEAAATEGARPPGFPLGANEHEPIDASQRSSATSNGRRKAIRGKTYKMPTSVPADEAQSKPTMEEEFRAAAASDLGPRVRKRRLDSDGDIAEIHTLAKKRRVDTGAATNVP